MPYEAFRPETKKSGGGTYMFLAVLAAILVGVVSYLLFFQIQPPKKKIPVMQEQITEKAESPAETPMPAEPMMEETPTAPVIAEPAEMSKPLNYVRYTVRRGDILTGISKKRYGTRFYWPLIYVKNKKLLKDQDILQPGTVLMIPDTVDTMAEEQRKALSESYFQAYKNFKKHGKRHKAVWLLYACETQVDPSFLNTYKNKINAADLRIVKRYLKRFPNPEKER